MKALIFKSDIRTPIRPATHRVGSDWFPPWSRFISVLPILLLEDEILSKQEQQGQYLQNVQVRLVCRHRSVTLALE